MLRVSRPSIWRETYLPSGTLHLFPNCVRVERRLRAFAPRRRDGVCGRPPLWPAGDPVAEGAACVRPGVSPPVRRPDARCRNPSSVVCRSFRCFGQAGHVPESLPAARERATFALSNSASSILIPLAPIMRGQRRKRGTRRNAATRPASGRGSIWRTSTAWRPGTIGGSMPPRPGQFFERELSHRKFVVHFACFRRTLSMIPQEIATRRARPPRSPFHGQG